MTPEQIKEQIEGSLHELGFSHFGWTPLSRPLSFAYYENWIAEGLHGDMKYLAEHAPLKETPQKQWPRAQSALVFAMNYYPHPQPSQDFPLKEGRISLYAQGMDYHVWFKQRLQELCQRLQEKHPGEEFLCFTDSSPVLERDLAKRAGLGWVGKNTCLIHPKKGSLFFIGEIYTSLKMQESFEPLPDFCGTCRKCIDICPTQALVEPRKLDARKCISYLTIESRTVPAPELRPLIHDWLFGCDLCQTVCPWNQKVFKKNLNTDLQLTLEGSKEEALIADLRYLLQSSGKKLGRDFKGTALDRAGSFGLKRNALVVIGNRRLQSLRSEVEKYLEHEKLGELAQWTLQELAKA